MKTIQLVLAIHNHQPVGNFEHVYEEACVRAYEPFLDCMDEFPDIPFVLHMSGSLLEWVEQHRPGLVERIAGMVRAGRVEVMGGGCYEPIMTMLPDRDRQGQVSLFSRRLRHLFRATVRGAWTAERVWEANLASSFADAGIEYTVVDDFHFKCAGLRDEDLLGYYVAEDQGRTLNVFSGSERLRYLIPFAEPKKCVEYLRSLASEDGRRLVVYADDGEKFGVWPKTHKHVYGDGWLRKFLRALHENRAWIRLTTFSDALANNPPLGRAYLPDVSYREMTEWALPPDVQAEFKGLEKELERCGLRERVRPFVRGATWRNFKARYAEAAQMHARMIEVSEALVKSRLPATRREKARLELYRGQCNCPYWHGAFGGLYLPFLRFETYRRLLGAEAALRGPRSRPACDAGDFDLDGRPEVRLTTPGAKIYVKPDRGGHIYEWDDLDKRCNLMANLTRRPEAYHRELLERAARGDDGAQEAHSIHDRLEVKEEGLEKRLVYDRWTRESLVDHLFDPAATLDDLEAGKAREFGALHSAPFAFRRQRHHALELLCKDGPARIEKRIAPDGPRGAAVRIRLLPRPEARSAVYACEFNVNLLAGDAPDRYYLGAGGENLGPLNSRLDLRKQAGISLADEWLGVEFRLRCAPEADVWALPVETVSGSEGGLERVYQGSGVWLRWPATTREVKVWIEVLHR